MSSEAQDFELVEPDPSALVESLRAFGYSVETSIADLIDNSITAEAKKISIDFLWDGSESKVLILDDGIGMSEEGLRLAMKPGSSNPLDVRSDKDLGRFGLGLKTASFSQARSLTVATKQKGNVSIRRWDLDHVGETKQWQLLKYPREGNEEHFKQLDSMPSGTLIIWELLDRVVGSASKGDEGAKRHFYAARASVEEHLGVVFHRFLKAKRNRIQILCNENKVEPWDPFLENSDATQQLAAENLILDAGPVRVTPFVLPHHSKLEKTVHTNAAGIKGWNASQGFYIYRADRLISAGGWFHSDMKAEPHYSLARIAVNISQGMDADWDIDVRKARARPPAELRDDLQRIARTTRRRAVEVYRHRGKRLSKRAGVTEKVDVWAQKKRDNSISYVLNRDHEIIKAALSIPTEYRSNVKALLDLVERTIPVQQIVLDGYENPERQQDGDVGQLDGALVDAAQDLFLQYRENGTTVEEAKLRILCLEPFFNHPEVIEALSESS